MLYGITIFVLAACAPQPRPGFVQSTQSTNRIGITEGTDSALFDQITVEDLRTTADLMARDLVVQPFLTQHKSPPIVAVKPIENKTEFPVDPDIFQKTIRVKLMEKAAGKILFRDEVSRDYTIEERVRQSGKVVLDSTAVHSRILRPTKVGAPLLLEDSSEVKTIKSQKGAASSKVADADYFLTGFIYSMKESVGADALRGNRYFQFQFRLTDVQNNIIIWEKEYTVKRHARFNNPINSEP